MRLLFALCLLFATSDVLFAQTAAKVPNVPNAEILSDIAYLPETRAEKLDLYLPKDRAKDKKLPLVIFVHGGGWAKGDKVHERSDNIGQVLVAEGYAVASINYRLAPEGQGSYLGNLKASFPQNVQDVKSAVRFLRKHADHYGLDPDRIALMGASAGAHLAVLAAYAPPGTKLEPTDDGLGDVPSKVQAVVGLYGVYDWASFQKKHIESDEDRALATLASPITWVDPNDPPTYLIHGTKDIYVKHTQTELLSKALEENQVPHQSVIVPGAPHSFDFRLKQYDLRADLLRFLAKHLQPRP